VKDNIQKHKKGSATSLLVFAIVILAVVILGLFGYSVSKENAKKKEIEKDIASLQAQAENIKKENMALSDRISYLGSKDYQEVQAKDKLNLQSPGESVVIIAPKNSRQNIVSHPAKNRATKQEDAAPNYRKWLAYFFKPQVF